MIHRMLANASKLRISSFHRNHTRHLATYAWGSASLGQLGLPEQLLEDESDTFGQKVSHPLPIPSLRNYTISCASASASHTAFVRADGSLFTCGYAKYGQLGLSDYNPRLEPTSVDGLPAIASVACGSKHTLALAEDGRVFAFGCNAYGQLGIGQEGNIPKLSNAPLLLQVFLDAGHRIVHIAAGDDFSAAVSDDGKVFTWGCPAQGRLGHGTETQTSSAIQFLVGDTLAVETSPRLVKKLDGVKIEKVFCGKHHIIALDRIGRAFAWGSGRHFHLGTGNEEDKLEPVETLPHLSKTGVKKISPGSMHSLILTQAGQVFAMGENENGCLGLGNNVYAHSSNEAVPVVGLTDVMDVSAGWNVSVAVKRDEDRNVVTWGCGIAGALGNDETVDHWAPYHIGLRASRVVVGNAGRSMVALQ